MNNGVYTNVSFTEESRSEREVKMVFVPDDDVDLYGYYWGNYNW